MEAATHVRWCPQCDEEFRPDIARCSDCGGALVERQLDASGNLVHPVEDGATSSETAVTALPADVTELTHARTTQEFRAMGDALDAAAVAFHAVFVPDPPGAARNVLGGRFVIAVHADDRANAIAALRPQLGIEAVEGDALAVERYDAAAGYTACPACGTQLAAGAQACAECGLMLGGDLDPDPGSKSES